MDSKTEEDGDRQSVWYGCVQQYQRASGNDQRKRSQDICMWYYYYSGLNC
ncbi:Hypothetical predicted protein [Mytilus galloprovincialis]|uniref:Uncharacterized protein n=1 Tax=Mytilus galloprovincialis TaxID=29158 RepID=A0A8B6HPJ2_MYTGA|nr:Hypothetical predicted protein [Mytilus galloprovincialis]